MNKLKDVLGKLAVVAAFGLTVLGTVVVYDLIRVHCTF